MEFGMRSYNDIENALRQIDEVTFERLVAFYLRRQHRELVELVVTGMNDQGETIPCPIDATLYIPGDPPSAIAVASTTTNRNDLPTKWLSTGKKRGDLPKAVDELAQWRKNEHNIKCILFLVTNCWLGSDTKLYRSAVQRGLEAGVEVHIIEGSRLLDFLQHDREGQYARQKLLGIEADRLSESLLHEIALVSLQQHRNRFELMPSNPATEIMRDARERVLGVLEASHKPVVGIRGASGMGKSVLLRQIGSEINSNGGLALWVPAEFVEPGISVASLLLNVLRCFYPSLSETAGEEAMEIARELPRGLMLLVDDVNRLENPRRALDAIRGWTSPSGPVGNSTPISDTVGLRFLMPVWRAQVIAAPFEPRKQTPDWEFVEIGLYSTDERERLAESLAATLGASARRVVELLDGDPFLCGLASHRSGFREGLSRSEFVRQILEDTVRDAAREAAEVGANRGIFATESECVAALDALIRLMLSDSDPEPELIRVREKLGDRTADLLHVLARTNRLGWIETGRDLWRWKHDRLRDALIGRWLARNVLSHNGQGYNREQRVWLSHPGLAEAWAMALLFLTDATMLYSAVDLLASCQPLALAEALRLRLFTEEFGVGDHMADGLRSALADFDETKDELVGCPMDSVLYKLARTDDPLVLRITGGLPRSWNIWAARLRNGELQSGFEWVSHEQARSGSDSPLRTYYTLLEDAISTFASLRSSSREGVAAQLSKTMENRQMCSTGMMLAGYIGWPELSKVIVDAWDSLSDDEKHGVLPPAIWALSRCGDELHSHKLEEMLLMACDEQNCSSGDRLSSLRLALQRWPVTTAAANTWAGVARQHPEARRTVCYLMQEIDDPATIETCVRLSAEGNAYWSFSRHGESVDPLATVQFEPIVPAKAVTRDQLWELVKDTSNAKLRKAAFRYWRQAAVPGDLEKLRSIQPEDDLFRDALRFRLRLRDRTAAPLLVERMREDPVFWAAYAPLVWREPGIEEVFFEVLEAALSDSGWGSSSAIQYLPPDSVRRLLATHQDLLLRTPRTWPRLWRTDVPEALTFVQQAISQAEPEILQYLFGSVGVPVSRRMLDALVPVLGRLPEVDVSWLATVALRSGHHEWVQRHIVLMNLESDRHYSWVDEDRLADILTLASRAVPKGVKALLWESDLIMLDYRPDVEGASEMIMRTARNWLGETPEYARLVVGGMLVAAFGRAEDATWWSQLRPADERAQDVWQKSLFILRRRRWRVVEGTLFGAVA